MGRINVCGMWKKKTAKGETFQSGSKTSLIKLQDLLDGNLGDFSFAVFRNTRKQKDTHPDYNLVIMTQDRQEQREDRPRQEQPKPKPRDDYYPLPPEDEIPF